MDGRIKRRTSEMMDMKLTAEEMERIAEIYQRTNKSKCMINITRSSEQDRKSEVRLSGIYINDVTQFTFDPNSLDAKDKSPSVLMPVDVIPGRRDYAVFDYPVFKSIMEKLHELTDGITPDMPDLQKFAIIYARICSFIDYDHEAVKTRDEKEIIKCRSLENGLLKGKCVCAGYATILSNALKMVRYK